MNGFQHSKYLVIFHRTFANPGLIIERFGSPPGVARRPPASRRTSAVRLIDAHTEFQR